MTRGSNAEILKGDCFLLVDREALPPARQADGWRVGRLSGGRAAGPLRLLCAASSPGSVAFFPPPMTLGVAEWALRVLRVLRACGGGFLSGLGVPIGYLRLSQLLPQPILTPSSRLHTRARCQ